MPAGIVFVDSFALEKFLSDSVEQARDHQILCLSFGKILNEMTSSKRSRNVLVDKCR